MCLPEDDSMAVDVGDMSRGWKTSEVASTSLSFVHQCIKSGSDMKKRVVQIPLGFDGLSVFAKTGSLAANCIAAMGGLTVAQLR